VGITIHYKKGELPPQIENSIEPKKFTNKELRNNQQYCEEERRQYPIFNGCLEICNRIGKC
jgi:hypothetical protein